MKKLQAEKLKPQEQLTLEPYERDHAVVVGTYRPPPKKAWWYSFNFFFFFVNDFICIDIIITELNLNS